MLRLKPKQRAVLIDKWPDLANLAMGGLVFGHFLSSESFSLLVALGGVGIWIGMMVVILKLAGEPQ